MPQKDDFPEGVAWDGSSQLTNLIWGLTLESRWRSHCLLINGGLTCPRTSISRCTPTTKAPRVETERWCLDVGFPGRSDAKGKQCSDRGPLRAVLGTGDAYFTSGISTELDVKQTESQQLAGCKLGFRSCKIKLKILKSIFLCSTSRTWRRYF